MAKKRKAKKIKVKRPMGRPPVAPEKRRDHHIMVRLSESERAILERYGEAQGWKLSRAVRELAFSQLRKKRKAAPK